MKKLKVKDIQIGDLVYFPAIQEWSLVHAFEVLDSHTTIMGFNLKSNKVCPAWVYSESEEPIRDGIQVWRVGLRIN